MYAGGSGGLERTEDAFEDVDEEADWIEAGGGEASMMGGLSSFVVWGSGSEASVGAVLEASGSEASVGAASGSSVEAAFEASGADGSTSTASSLDFAFWLRFKKKDLIENALANGDENCQAVEFINRKTAINS